MSVIYKKILNLKPVYLTEFRELIESHSQFGGGADETKFIKGKSFSNAYEIYMYAFFIGLQKEKRLVVLKEDDSKSFWEMENWKPRELVDYLIACVVAVSKFDMVGVEQMEESSVSEQIKIVQGTIESYANGGLRYIADILRADPDLIDDDMFFINLLSAK